MRMRYNELFTCEIAARSYEIIINRLKISYKAQEKVQNHFTSHCDLSGFLLTTKCCRCSSASAAALRPGTPRYCCSTFSQNQRHYFLFYNQKLSSLLIIYLRVLQGHCLVWRGLRSHHSLHFVWIQLSWAQPHSEQDNRVYSPRCYFLKQKHQYYQHYVSFYILCSWRSAL